MWGSTRRKIGAVQFLVYGLGKVSTLNFWKACFNHPSEKCFVCNQYGLCKQKLKIEKSQQQYVVLERFSPLWTIFPSVQFLVYGLGKVSTLNFWKACFNHPSEKCFVCNHYSLCKQKLKIEISQQQNVVLERFSPLWNSQVK